MTWRAISKYAIRNGPWTITKAYVRGAARYLLWHSDKVHSGPYGTADEAKGRAR